MPELSFAAQVARLNRSLDAFARRQVTFATALALTTTARRVRDEIQAKLPTTFDRPNPFTQRAISYRPASKATLTATVLVLPRQAEYLRIQETGGIGRPRVRAFAIPRVPEMTDAYGNIGKGAIGRALGRSRTQAFVGTVRGTAGVWQRQPRTPAKPSGGLRLLVRFEGPSQYRPRFGFQETAQRAASEAFPRIMSGALRRALETARA